LVACDQLMSNAVLDSHVHVHRALGDYAYAIECYTAQLAIHREITQKTAGEPIGVRQQAESSCLSSLATAYDHIGTP
jgi:hypothetical protein